MVISLDSCGLYLPRYLLEDVDSHESNEVCLILSRGVRLYFTQARMERALHS